MATSSSASNYISKINISYPVAGIDNDTQGFRDNFKNIKLALDATDADVYDLKLNAVSVANPVSDFNNNIIKQVQLQDSSVTIYDDTSVVRTDEFEIDIDYRKGSYQVFAVSSGTYRFSVSNWPGAGKSGSLTLSITTSTTAATTVNFAAQNVYNLGPDNLPFNITNQGKTIIHLWSDGDDDNLYVKKVNQNTKFTKPMTLANYTTSTLAALGSVDNGSMAFLTPHNRPVYYSNGAWYLMTGTVVTL